MSYVRCTKISHIHNYNYLQVLIVYCFIKVNYVEKGDTVAILSTRALVVLIPYGMYDYKLYGKIGRNYIWQNGLQVAKTKYWRYLNLAICNCAYKIVMPYSLPGKFLPGKNFAKASGNVLHKKFARFNFAL